MIADLLQKMEDYAAANQVPIIRKQACNVFCDAVRKADPKCVLEIGTAIGYSALLIASASPELEKITTLELSEERAALARKFIKESPYADKIEILVGDAGEMISGLTGEYDLVFIDAAKGQYPDYWRKIQPLLAEKVTVLADNVLFRGYIEGNETAPRRFRTIVKRIKEYLDLVDSAEGFSTEILRDGDGLAVSRRDRYEKKA